MNVDENLETSNLSRCYVFILMKTIFCVRNCCNILDIHRYEKALAGIRKGHKMYIQR